MTGNGKFNGVSGNQDSNVMTYRNHRISQMIAPAVTAEDPTCGGMIDSMGGCYVGDVLVVFNYKIWHIPVSAESNNDNHLCSPADDIEVIEDYTEHL